MPSIRVYEYGLLPPHINGDLIDQQMVKAHRYRNMLVEIERERRDKVRAAMGAHPDLAPLEEQLRSLNQQRDDMRISIQNHRRRTRKRDEPAEWRQAVKDLTGQIKPLRDQVKTVRKAVAEDSTVKAAMAAAEEHAKIRLKKARAECGVYWGTYLLQEQAADQARKERTPPRFVRWQGEGRVSVQIQKGIPLSELWGEDTQIQIQPVHPDAWDASGRVRRGIRRRLSRTVLRLRVGSEGPANRTPIWAEWRMVMHRPIPEGAVIKVATVSRRRRDCVSWDWRVQLTVDVTACASTRVVPESGAVALNLGFCVRQNGAIRSGFLVGDDGMEQEILVGKSDNVREMSPAAPGPDGEGAAGTSQAVPGQLDLDSPGHVDGTSPAEQGRASADRTGSVDPGHERSRDGSNSAVDAEAEDAAAPGHHRTAKNWITNGLSKAESIRSFRDKAMDKMKALLVSWRAGEEVSGETVADVTFEFSKGEPGRAETGQSSGPGTESDCGSDQPRLTGTTLDKAMEQPGATGTGATSSQDQPGGAGTTPTDPRCPEWFTKATEAIHAWRSAERFRRLAYTWKTQRFPGDTAMFMLVWAWRGRDEHLERYESGLRRSALRDRREGYRIIAAKMARRYRFLVIDDTDLAEFQRSPATESTKVEIPAVKYNQRVAAGSELRGAMINAFGEHRVIKLSHKDNTRRCHLCGHINIWDRVAADRFHTCDGCGERWDQDCNNGKNLLAEHRRASETPEVARSGKSATSKPSRSTRFREARIARSSAGAARAS